MSLRDRISEDLKRALAADDKLGIATLRLIQTAIRDRDAALQSRAEGRHDGRGDTGPEGRKMRDDDILAVLARMVEMRRESLRSYEEGAQFDLVEREQAEIDLIAAYLPRPMSDDEVAAEVEAIVRESGAATIRDMGRVMTALKQRHAGRMDMATAGPLVLARLTRRDGQGGGQGEGESDEGEGRAQP